MATFIGTDADEIITPPFVSPTVTAVGGAHPTGAADTVDGGGGNDTVDGSGGNDSLTGGLGNDSLTGGNNDDTVTGGLGNDVAILGAGTDRFVWNPGDGSDLVDGGTGTDTLQFTGALINETIGIFANGARALLTRDVGAVSMDLDGIEHIQLRTLGGIDRITVNDLSGTDVTQVAIDLTSPIIGGTHSNVVTVNGTTGNDHIAVGIGGASVIAQGLAAQVTIDGAIAGLDTLAINGLDGNDSIDASALPAGWIGLAIDAGIGNDTVTGSGGNDTIHLGDGNDRVVWNSGGGSDVIEGDTGTDTLAVNGSDDTETFTVATNGARVQLTRDLDGASLDINAVETIVINAGVGNDAVNASSLSAGMTLLVVDGGTGNDTITGSRGNDTLNGDNGDDLVIGGQGNDSAFLGGGNDTFVWNPGDGNDLVEGQTGTDTLLFNGANINEKIGILANGARVLFTRDIANIAMDLDGVEHIRFVARGGTDSITVNDLTGTAVKQVDVDLSATGDGGTGGDSAADLVTANGTAGADHITVATSGALIDVDGLAAALTINGSEAANDALTVNGLGGADAIDASGLAVAAIGLTADGGDANDTITGSVGGDRLLGGAGADSVTGGLGSDVAFLGDGNDRFVWNPGDGSDIVEGQTGTDTLEFNGAALNEIFTVSANGARVLLTRDVGSVLMDLNSVEHVQIDAAAGFDTVTVNDLTGTGVTLVAIDLAAAGTASGDGQADRLLVNGGAGNETVTLALSGGAISVTGLAATVTVAHADPTLDTLTVAGNNGDDRLDASALPAGQIGLTLSGGIGNDTIFGSQGDDTVTGGMGSDVAHLGAGTDLFAWNPGDGSDAVDGQSGTDTLAFSGSNINERMTLSASGAHALLLRDIATVTVDTTGIEKIQIATLGGTDTITVNDLTGTGVKQVAIDLGVIADNQPDAVFVNGSGAADKIGLTASGTIIAVKGLAAAVTIDHAESSHDALSIDAGAGNDTIDASGLPAGILPVTLAGGDGNDVITGGGEDDVFLLVASQTGRDVVNGFQAHGANLHGDLVRIMGSSDATFDQAIGDGDIAQLGTNVVISDGTHVLGTLHNIMLATLHANDFQFV